MSGNKKILTICGSLRRGSIHKMLESTVAELCPEDVTVVSAPPFASFAPFDGDLLEEHGIPAEVQTLADAILDADGVLFISPEYNHAIPGTLKNAIDWISKVPEQPLKGKPIALQSGSPGILGGARSQVNMRQIMNALDAPVLSKPEVFVNLANDKFDAEAGRLTDEIARKIITDQLAAFSDFITYHRGAAA